MVRGVRELRWRWTCPGTAPGTGYEWRHHDSNNPRGRLYLGTDELTLAGARGTAPTTWPDDKGFLGKPKDTTGLTHVGAREYDPALDRFISVDPIMDLADPQQMHGYAYAHNSPAPRSDPTGLYDPDLRGDKCQGGDPRCRATAKPTPSAPTGDPNTGSGGAGPTGGPGHAPAPKPIQSLGRPLTEKEYDWISGRLGYVGSRDFTPLEAVNLVMPDDSGLVFQIICDAFFGGTPDSCRDTAGDIFDKGILSESFKNAVGKTLEVGMSITMGVGAAGLEIPCPGRKRSHPV